jgi:chemotaxis protein methyltransferase CheR
MKEADLQDIEVGLVLEALALRHGYDFRHYAKASMKRRVLALAQAQGLSGIAELIPRLLRDEEFLPEVLSRLSVPVTEMFRDAGVFLALRREILPILASYPSIAIWQAGCATGEEAYSLAIMLKEEGLLHKTQIYATDINDVALAKAEEGIYPDRIIASGSANYLASGGKASLGDYFHSAYDFSKISDEIRQRIVFAHHNLAADGVFCEMHMVLCRNVLIYFERSLQNRVVGLFHEGLVRGGFLCLGNRESLQFTTFENQFRVVDHAHRIYKKQGGGT